MQLAKLEQIKTAVYVSSSRVEKRPVTDRPGWGRLAPWAPQIWKSWHLKAPLRQFRVGYGSNSLTFD